jgi:ABC-2 type transport system permease protein
MPAERALPATSGVIHDIGYRGYSGTRYGRAQITGALYVHSLRAAFGLGRGVRAKLIPVLALVVLTAPAVVNAVAMARGSARLITYDTYIFQLRAVVMIIFVAAQAPELVSRDLRSHVLPLYFARPMHATDYPGAKLGALITACLVVLEVPLLVLYAGTISQVHSASAVWAQTRALVPGLLVGLAWAVLLAAIGLALASLTGRRAYATGSIAVYFFLTLVLTGILYGITTAGQPGRPAGGASLVGLISPFTVLDGVRQWLGGTSPGPVSVGGTGAAYGAMFLGLLAVCAGGLSLRYRRLAAA